MKKEYINKCIELTEKILTYTHQGDISPIIEYMHEDCLWIGPLDNQFCYGKENIIKTVLKQKTGYPRIYLRSQEFTCGAQDRHGCIIIGKYMAVADYETDSLFRSMQRATFVWKLLKDRLYIMHLHISSPRETEGDQNEFTQKIGVYTKNYLNMLIRKEVEKSGHITIKDQENIHHIIQVNDIIYCEAYDICTVIHTIDEDIFGRVMLAVLEKDLVGKDADMFIRVHKSFVVNKYYVNSIKRYQLHLINDISVPVSKEKYKSIMEKLHI